MDKLDLRQGVIVIAVMWLAACTTPQPTATPTPGELVRGELVRGELVRTLTAEARFLPTATLAPAARAATETAAPPVIVPTADATGLPGDAPARIQYTVRPGDTLLGIALQQHVSMASIQLANDLGESDVLRAGQSLQLPTRPLWEGESPYWVVHTVQSGETVVGIARASGLTADDILRVNSIADPALIRPGQAIVLPLETLLAAVAPPTATPRPTARPAATHTPVAPATKTPARAAASPQATPGVTPTAKVMTPVPAAVAAWPSTVAALINQKRAAHGLPALTIAPELANAAQAHAADCAKRGWCGHVGSDGADTRTREIRAGYMPTAWGENWVQAFDPVKAVEWWYNEPPGNDPHRQNILNTRYTQVGIGITPAGNGYYFIADFGSR